MLLEGSFALASFGKVRKVHETAFAVAFGRRSVAVKRILDTAFESPSSPGEATFSDRRDVLLTIKFAPIDRVAFVRPAMSLCAFSPLPGDIKEPPRPSIDNNLTVEESCNDAQIRVPNSSKQHRRRLCLSCLSAQYNECEAPLIVTHPENTTMAKIFHSPLFRPNTLELCDHLLLAGM